MSEQSDEFERVIIARELVRRPEIKFLAGVLYTMTTGDVEKNDIPPIYITIAYKIITKPEARALLIAAIGAAIP
jgi:hypothetical protein